MTRLLGVQTAKEVRQLLPWWVAVSAGLVAWGQLSASLKGPHGDPTSMPFLLTYFAGAAALGALAVGHEYSHRTLGALLAQPVDRHRLLLRKLVVLAIALIALIAVARWQMPADLMQPGWTARILLLPALLALSVTPWWTMASRGPLAGGVLSVAAPIILVFGAQYVMNMMEPEAQARLTFDAPFVMWWGMLALCAVGAVMTWRAFGRLQAIDGPHAEIGVPARLRATEGSRLPLPQTRSAFGSLLRKELHLHRMTFLAAGACLAIWMAVTAMRTVDPAFLRGGSVDAPMIYAYLLALLAGSVTIAEERQIGMADWQLLLPIGTRTQWAIKAGTALSLTALLAIALPDLLASKPLYDRPWDVERRFFIAGACCLAVYVSSCSTSGMRAFLTSLPVLAGTAYIGFSLLMFLNVLLQPAFLAILTPYRETLRAYVPLFQDVSWYFSLGMLPTLSLFLLSFASANYRTVDRSPSRIIRQCFWLTAVLVLLWTCFGLLMTLGFVPSIRQP